MAVIYSYPKLSTLQDKDLLLISDVSSKNKPTNRVELGTIRTYINSFIDVGVVGSGTANTLPMWTDSQELGDSPLFLHKPRFIDPPLVRVNGSFQVFEVPTSIPRILQKTLAGPGFRSTSPGIGQVDPREGFVRIGGGNGKHALSLYTSSALENELDAKAFQYEFNDGYTFARIEAEDYFTNINPLWEVGDVISETTGFAWRVNFGGYAEFSRKAFSPFTAFKITPTLVESNVNVTVSGDIQTVGIDSTGAASLGNGDYLFESGGAEFSAELDMTGNKITRCGDPTLSKDAANKSYVDSSLPQLADNFPNDTAAALAGVLVGGLYHTAGVVKIRVS